MKGSTSNLPHRPEVCPLAIECKTRVLIYNAIIIINDTTMWSKASMLKMQRLNHKPQANALIARSDSSTT